MEEVVCEVNSLEELVSQKKGSILIGVFSNEGSNEEELVFYNGLTSEGRICEFLEPGKRYWANPDIDIHAWRLEKEKIVFPGNGTVLLPIKDMKMQTYSPSENGYSERRRLIDRELG